MVENDLIIFGKKYPKYSSSFDENFAELNKNVNVAIIPDFSKPTGIYNSAVIEDSINI